MKTIYEFSVKDRKNKDVSLKEYANEVLLIVNTATKCGFTPQYDELLSAALRHSMMNWKPSTRSIMLRALRFSTSPATSSASRPLALTRASMSSVSLTLEQNSLVLRKSR